MTKSESIAGLAKALLAFQAELPTVKKDATNPFFKSKYADLNGIWEACRPLLTKHDLALTQLHKFQEGQIILTTMLLHISGEYLTSDLLLTPAKANDPQSVGSAMTYARRYAMGAMLGVATEDDDDGEKAMARDKKPIPQETSPKPSVPNAHEDITIENLGDLFSTCFKLWGMNQTQVCKELGVAGKEQIGDVADAFLQIKAIKG